MGVGQIEVAARAAQRPHLILVSTVEALEGAPGAPAPELDGYGPVSSATARMLACDGEVTEVVVDHLGRPLQVKEPGKPTRKQRLAVIARDVRCIGCGAPAARCQLHAPLMPLTPSSVKRFVDTSGERGARRVPSASRQASPCPRRRGRP